MYDRYTQCFRPGSPGLARCQASCAHIPISSNSISMQLCSPQKYLWAVTHVQLFDSILWNSMQQRSFMKHESDRPTDIGIGQNLFCHQQSARTFG
eukprot:scaffold69265_cov16-Tisochrysis_lutea.AAC.2